MMPDYSQGSAWTTPTVNQSTNVPQGQLGLQPGAQANLGTGTPSSSALQDFGDSFMGHASYAPGAGFGGNANANQYALGASALGQSQLNYDQGLGANGAQQLQGLGVAANDQYQQLGNTFAGQGPAQANYGMANQYGLANQGQALGMYQAAAQGQGPSAAQAQLQSGLDQSIAAQQSAAASTRGGFGLANAQHQAAVNAGQLQGQAANNAAQLRAQEQQAGMAGYAGLASTVQGQQAANAQYNAGLQQQQQLANAQNQMAAYNLGSQNNLAYQQAAQNALLGYQTLGQNTNLNYNQLGEQAMGQQLSADVANQQSTNSAMQGNAGRQQQGAGGILSMIGSLF